MSEIKKNQVYRLVGPFDHVAYAIVLERKGEWARVMMLSDDIHTVRVERNDFFGSEFCKVPGRHFDFIMSSACAMKKNDDRELYEMITSISAARRDCPTTDPSTRPCRGTGTSRIHEDDPSSSDMGDNRARAVCRKSALQRLPFRFRQIARAFSFIFGGV